MKMLLPIAMAAIITTGVFGADVTKESSDNCIPVVTGGWHEMPKSELDESILTFIYEYFGVLEESSGFSIEQVWTQLIQGRRFLIAFRTDRITSKDETLGASQNTSIGLLRLKRDFDGTMTVEKNYSYTEIFALIGDLLTAEIQKKHLDTEENGGEL